ncbi:hypothetical protein [Marinomonas sp. IMCC 4694]|uniref:hypothetical protein n=1 Tax=Marinomonas sp. IMCC 4694 TaxID=2605432 RepID=UPI0011E747C2|nr:hypothetical protein [Marinomonas sp. IMCC 4694]TYL49258.1 hypothetical protein FXV75_15870 [Marinomonas sp. IMCC 4694]
MNTELQVSLNSGVVLQGCAYRILNDRIVISIEKIANNRVNHSLSGTLRVQMCALPLTRDLHAEPLILASTTIGEINDQHCLVDCVYDLIFQQPLTGSWQLCLQLSEWNGNDYVACDIAYFSLPYHVELTDAELTHIEPTDVELTSAEPTDVKTKAAEPNEQQPDSIPATTKAIETKEEVQSVATVDRPELVKKNATGCSTGYIAINQSKVDQLLKVKGVSKKVLEKLIAERPFPSDKAVLNVKGMGPVMLAKVIHCLSL